MTPRRARAQSCKAEQKMLWEKWTENLDLATPFLGALVLLTIYKLKTRNTNTQACENGSNVDASLYGYMFT